jgi:hypothetical protein
MPTRIQNRFFFSIFCVFLCVTPVTNPNWPDVIRQQKLNWINNFEAFFSSSFRDTKNSLKSNRSTTISFEQGRSNFQNETPPSWNGKKWHPSLTHFFSIHINALIFLFAAKQHVRQQEKFRNISEKGRKFW